MVTGHSSPGGKFRGKFCTQCAGFPELGCESSANLGFTCLRCLDKSGQHIFPNGCLMEFYHGTKQKVTLNKSKATHVLFVPMSEFDPMDSKLEKLLGHEGHLETHILSYFGASKFKV